MRLRCTFEVPTLQIFYVQWHDQLSSWGYHQASDFHWQICLDLSLDLSVTPRIPSITLKAPGYLAKVQKMSLLKMKTGATRLELVVSFRLWLLAISWNVRKRTVHNVQHNTHVFKTVSAISAGWCSWWLLSVFHIASQAHIYANDALFSIGVCSIYLISLSLLWREVEVKSISELAKVVEKGYLKFKMSCCCSQSEWVLL